MKQRVAPAASGYASAAAAAVLSSSLLLLSACCVRPCEGFAPPLNRLSNGNSNHHLSTAAPASRAALATEARSGMCLLTSRRDRLQPGRATTRSVAAGVFSGLRTPVASARAANAAATEFEDPLGGEGAPTAVLEGVEQEVAPKKKRKPAPRKKICVYFLYAATAAKRVGTKKPGGVAVSPSDGHLPFGAHVGVAWQGTNEAHETIENRRWSTSPRRVVWLDRRLCKLVASLPLLTCGVFALVLHSSTEGLLVFSRVDFLISAAVAW